MGRKVRAKILQEDEDLEVEPLEEIDQDILQYPDHQRETIFMVKATTQRVETQNKRIQQEKEAFWGRFPNMNNGEEIGEQ